MHIARLREKIGEDVIVTVRGKGYMLGEAVETT
jgi:DNA-binding response OmpR family regulator